MNKISLLLTTIFAALPVIVSAQSGSVTGNSGNNVSLTNPLGQGTSINSLLLDILDVILLFAIPVIVFMIIYAGFLYVTAQGNEGKIGKAHKALLYAIIGGVLILTADILLYVIQGTVDAFRS